MRAQKAMPAFVFTLALFGSAAAVTLPDAGASWDGDLANRDN